MVNVKIFGHVRGTFAVFGVGIWCGIDWHFMNFALEFLIRLQNLEDMQNDMGILSRWLIQTLRRDTYDVRVRE